MGVLKTLKKSTQLNRKLLWLQICVFLFNLGFGIIFPYLTLQMHSIGLTIEEISYINGICPAIIIFTLPLSGFLGDMFGYKLVLTIAIIITGTAATCFDLVPRAFETERHPILQMSSTSSSLNGSLNFIVKSLLWPLCSGDDNSTDVTNFDSCLNSFPVNSSEFFFTDYQQYIVCNGEYFDPVTSQIELSLNFTFDGVTHLKNGSFCSMSGDNASIVVDESDVVQVTCQILNHPNLMETCIEHNGSHFKTFAIYFALYLLFKLAMNSVFGILDGTILRMCKQHNSDYSVIQFYVCIAVTISPFISSLTIRDAPEGSEDETDYQIAFYTYDAFLFLSLCVLLLKVDVQMDKSESGTLFKSLTQLFTPSAFIFLANIFFCGILWGIHDGYLFLYLGEKRQASSSLLAYLSVTGSISCLFVVPFAKAITKFFGHINVIYFQIMLESARLLVYSFVESSPPYYAFALFALDFSNYGLAWIAAITYGYKIAPPNLAATMAAIVNTIQYVLAKGLSILIGGQFLSMTSSSSNPDITDKYYLGCDQSNTEYCSLFRLTAVIAAAGATVVTVVYYIIGRKLEEKLLRKMGDVGELKNKIEDEEIYLWNVANYTSTKL